LFWRTLLLSLVAAALHAQSAVELLSQVDLAEARQAAFRSRQSYVEEQRNWQLDDSGQRIPSTARRKTFAVRFRNGQRFRELVARDGVALDPAELALQSAAAQPLKPASASPHADLANTHRLSFSASPGAPIILEANPLSGEGKRHLFLIDSATKLILEHTVETLSPDAAFAPGSRTVSRFAITPSGQSLLTSVEVEFSAKINGAPYRGLQMVSYSLHHAAPES
jgi:hypothetical protein